MNESTPFCDDAAFGPVIRGCRQDFDFTLAFQQYIFSVVPSALLLLAAPLRIVILRRHSAKVDGSILKNVKLVCCYCLVLLPASIGSNDCIDGHRLQLPYSLVFN